MTLKELVNWLKNEYPQTTIEAEVFDFEKINNIKKSEPKYFFRGESKLYDNTTSSFLRLFQKQMFNKKELSEFISIHFKLYLFLREAIWKIPVSEKQEQEKPFIEIAIAGMLQHYGFDTSFLDLTSNIEIAAYFASLNSTGETGKLLVIETEGLNRDEINYYFDLTNCRGNRPKIQKSYVIWDQHRNLDLQNKNFLTKHNGKWFEFKLDDNDKSFFFDQSILSTKKDEVVYQINEWWLYSEIKRKICSPQVKDYIESKVENLNKLCF